jgi:hypothetical protein
LEVEVGATASSVVLTVLQSSTLVVC